MIPLLRRRPVMNYRRSIAAGYRYMSSHYLFQSVNEGVVVNLFKTFAREEEVHKGHKALVLTAKEIPLLLNSLGEYPTKHDIRSIVDFADKNGDGKIELNEFVGACDKILSPIQDLSHRVEDLVQQFNVLDVNQDGFISIDELEGVLSTGGSKFSRAESEALVQAADKNEDHVIDLNEFISFLTSTEYVTKNHWRLRLRSTFRVIYLIGGPCSGKGTLSQKIVEAAKLAHISCGDILREEVEAATPLGVEIEQIIKNGQLVKPDVVMALLRLKMARSPGKIVLLDGFPRSRSNAEDFHRLCGKPLLVINLNCPEECMIERVQKRAAESEVKRADDNLDTMKKRLGTFKSQSQPAMEYLREIKVPIVELDATKNPDEVWSQLVKHENPISRRAQALKPPKLLPR